MRALGAVLPAPSFVRQRGVVTLPMRAWLLFVCLLTAWGMVRAQTTQTYAYQNNAFAWDAPSASAASVTWENTTTCDRANDDTKRTVAFPAGFAFTFNGVAYAQVRVLTNGVLQFSTANDGFHTDYTPQALPAPASTNPAGGGCSNTAPQNILLPYWIDITTTPYSGVSNAFVRHELLGVAPNRSFVITWDNVALFGNPATRYTFQAVLFEGPSPTCLAAAPTAAQCANGEFEYRYTTGASNGTGATVGVQLSNTDYTQYAYNQAFIDTTNGTALRWYPAPPLSQQPLAAEYRFDDAIWAGTTGEVRDTSGNGLHGVRVGAANTTAAQFRICRAGTFPSNTSNASIDAAALGNPTTSTGYAPGAEGSATFWYRPNANGAAAMLLDATAAANRPFFIMRNASNGISFRLSDSAGTAITATTGAVTTANTWIHVAVSWKVVGGTNATILQIFINGTLSVVQRGTTNGTLAAVARPAFIGDNRTSGVTPSGGTGNSANGFIDEVRIYDNEISAVQARGDYNASRTNCAVLDHFDISIDGVTGTSATNVSARTCDQAEVIITARDSLNNPVVIASNASLSVSTHHGTWTPVAGVSGFVDTGNGGASFTFNNSSTATFRINNPIAETASLNINSGGIVESPAADPSLVTTAAGCAAGFNACEPAMPQCTPAAAPLTYAALFTKLAGTGFSLEGVTLKSNGTLEPGFSGNVSVELLANINTGVSLGANNCPVSLDAMIPLGNVSFTGGRATINNISIANAYRDVRIRFTCTAAVCGSPVTACSSDNFAVRPQALTVAANLGGPTLKAGHGFALTAASGVASGYTGTPILDPAQLRDHNGAPAGTLNGTFAAATGSSATGTFQYHDVGTISLLMNAVTDSGYTTVDQATGDCVVGSAANIPTAGRYGCTIGSVATGPIGRFYPDHFTYIATLTPANTGGFSYMNQPALGIDLSLEARSLNETVTTRYTTGYGNLGTFSITGDNAGTAVSLARLSPPLPAFAWSNGRYVASSATTAFARGASPDGPFDNFALQANILSEPDGVALSGSNSSNATRIRFGRYRLINYYGSELLKPQVEYRAEYWNGNRWATNTLDSSNPILAANVATGGLTVNGLTALSNGSGFITFNTAAAGSYDIALNLNAAGSDTSCNAMHGGAAANKPWLQGYWSAPANCGGVAAWAQDPNARIRLGSSRAPYIYLRERY